MNDRNIFQTFQESCRIFSSKACVKFKKEDTYEVLTYEDIYRRVCVLRQFLLEAGIKPGQRVALLLSNGPYWPVAFFSLMSIQAVAVPLDVQMTPEQLGSILVHSETKMLLTEEKFGISLDDALSQTAKLPYQFLDRLDFSKATAKQDIRDERSAFGSYKLAVLFYTSGTTQERKAVMLTHSNLLANYESIRRVVITTQDDVILSFLPLHHTYPFMVSCFWPILVGVSVCYLPSLAYHELFNCIRENKVTIFVGVPQLFSLIAHSINDQVKKFGVLARWTNKGIMNTCAWIFSVSGVNVSKIVMKKLHAAFGPQLRLLASGGAKLDPRVALDFYRWGFDMIEGYGLTETSPIVSVNYLRSKKFNSVGKSIPGVVVKIVNHDKERVGEVAIRGANVMLGYYRALNLSRKVLQEGWFLSGDRGTKDKDGYLYLSGRTNELIVLPSGKKINPEEVEAHYSKSAFIKEICILYDKKEEHLMAVIVADEERLKSQGHVNIHFKIKWELDSFSQKLPLFQRIHGFVLIKESLPRTRLGKLIRYKIEKKFADGIFERPQDKAKGSRALSEFEHMALDYLSRILKREVFLEDHLELDLGLDSLGRIELLAALQELVDVGIDDSLAMELFMSRTIEELITKARQALPDSAFSTLLKREDMVFWPHVLATPPTEENQQSLKMHFDFFDTVVSFLEILLIWFYFRVFFSLRVEGKKNIPKEGSFVITPNHVSYLDVFYVLCAMPFSMIQKTYFVGFSEIFNHPLLRWAVRFHRLIPIDTSLNLAETLRVCQYILKKGYCLMYFPEGQRSIDGKVKEFRKGIGILAKESKAKILPVYLDGAYKAWPRTRPVPLPANVCVKIGPIVDTKEIKIPLDADPYIEIASFLRKKVEELTELKGS